MKWKTGIPLENKVYYCEVRHGSKQPYKTVLENFAGMWCVNEDDENIEILRWLDEDETAQPDAEKMAEALNKILEFIKIRLQPWEMKVVNQFASEAHPTRNN